jgi:hypothetical protein
MFDTWHASKNFRSSSALFVFVSIAVTDLGR